MPPEHALAPLKEHRAADEEEPVPGVEAVPDAGDNLRDENVRETRLFTLGRGPVVHVVTQPYPRLHVPVVGNLHERRSLLHSHRTHVGARRPSRLTGRLVHSA